MLIFTFIYLFGGPRRISLHTYIFQQHNIFSHGATLQRHFSRCVLNAPFNLQSETSHLSVQSLIRVADFLMGRMQPITGRGRRVMAGEVA